MNACSTCDEPIKDGQPHTAEEYWVNGRLDEVIRYHIRCARVRGEALSGFTIDEGKSDA